MNKISILSFAQEKINYIFNNNEKYIKWGVENKVPFEYLELYESIVEHNSAINFILTNLITDGIEEIDYWTLQKLALDYLIFGGFSIEVIKTRGSYQLKYIDISKVRLNPNKTMLGYSEDWGKYNAKVSWVKISKNINEAGIYWFKNPKSRKDYPSPYWMAAETNLNTMKNIIDYHYNNSENGFSPSVIINFNNGEPDPDTKKEIEKKIEEKFTGSKGKKFLLSYNDNKETATEIIKLESDNLDEKFETLQKFIQNQIIISHQITSGQLIGIKPENTGFSKTEYEEALTIFKSVIIKGFKKEIEYGLSALLNKEIKLPEGEVK